MNHITTVTAEVSDLEVALNNLVEAGFEFSIVDDLDLFGESAPAAA